VGVAGRSQFPPARGPAHRAPGLCPLRGLRLRPGPGLPGGPGPVRRLGHPPGGGGRVRPGPGTGKLYPHPPAGGGPDRSSPHCGHFRPPGFRPAVRLFRHPPGPARLRCPAGGTAPIEGRLSGQPLLPEILMRQLLLDLVPDTPPTLDNFVPGGNGTALAALTAWLGDRQLSFHLWGETGSGKTHLLRASGLCYGDARQDPDLADLPGDAPGLAVDNGEALSEAGQVALFNHFNRLRLAGENGHRAKLLVASDQPPAALALREDLRTRLGSALIFRLLPLSDEEKLAALGAQAAARKLKLGRDALTYLLSRSARDMGSLSALLVALDRYSLEQQRPITLPLLREVLQHEGGLENR